MCSERILERMFAIEDKIDKLIEKLDELKIRSGDFSDCPASDYSVEKLKEIGMEELPTSEMFTTEDLMKISKSNDTALMKVFNALCVGFSNGVKYSQK